MLKQENKEGKKMNAINGNLDMSKKYKLIDVEYGELSEGIGECCENCGNLIANVAIVEQDTGKKYRIGLDCMQTITHMNPLESQQAKNIIARQRKLYKHLKTEAKTIVINHGYDTAFSYKRSVDKWDSFWKYRFSFKTWEHAIKKLGIPVIIEAENA